MQPDLTDTANIDRHYSGDPAELVDAIATLLLAMQRPAWMRSAACRGMDTSTWFPGRGRSTRQAIETCEVCPVRSECRSWAIEHDEVGIWAGTSSATRKAMRKAS